MLCSVRNAILFALLLLCTTIASAQVDTLHPDEIAVLQKSFNNSSIAKYWQAVDYSRRRDTAIAAKKLLEVDPYYLLWEWEHTEDVAAKLKKFHFNQNIIDTIEAGYFSILKTPKSAAYKRFKKMAEDDKAIREKLTRCDDSFSCAVFKKAMVQTDSANFSGLYNYVATYGWPSMADGSLYATLIAIHDHARHKYYLPYLKQAVQNGQTDIKALMLVNHFLATSGEIDRILNEMKVKQYRKYQLNDLLKFSPVISSGKIEKLFRQSCGKNFRYYFIFEAPDDDIFSLWMNMSYTEKKKPAGKHVLEILQEQLKPNCPSKIKYTDLWEVLWQPSEKTGLFMVVIFD